MKEIIFVGDPMCSWCWGFAPVLEKLRKNTKVHFQLLVGGLRSSGDQIWDENFKTYLQHHWDEVHRVTGQAFNDALFQRTDFDYNTEPACLAVVTVRKLLPEKTFEYFHALQKAFYEDGLDITKEENLIEIAIKFGIPNKKFKKIFESKDMAREVEKDKSKAKMLGASVFPTIVVIDQAGHLNAIRGYRDYASLLKMLG